MTDSTAKDRRWERALGWLLTAGIVAGAANAVHRFPNQWDYLSYHLPAALQIFHATTFAPYDYLAATIAGHPPAAQAVMGALIAVTGRVSASALLGGLSLAILLAGFCWLAGDARQVRWLLFTALAVPLVTIHLFVPYIDLWTGAWLGLAVFAAVRSVHSGLRWRDAVVFCLGTGVAGLSKMPAWPPLAALWLWAAAHWIYAAWVRRTESRLRVGVTLGLAAALLALWPVRNALLLGNPTYPWIAPGLSRWFPPSGFATSPSRNDNYHPAPYLRDQPGPVRFLCSVLEAGRWQRPVVRYTHDMWNDTDSMRPHHEMGGWGLWTVALLGWWSAHWWRRDRRARTALGLFLVLAAVVSCLPLCHNLRYWFFLPLGAIATLVHFDLEFAHRRWWAVLACLAATLWQVSAAIVAPGAESQTATTPPAAREFWAHARRDVRYAPVSDCTAIFWAGPDFNMFQIGPGGAPVPDFSAVPR